MERAPPQEDVISMEHQGPLPDAFLAEVLARECAGGAVIIGSSNAQRSLVVRQIVAAVLARRSDRRALAVIRGEDVPLWQSLRVLRPTSTYLRQEQLSVHEGIATDKTASSWLAFEGQFPAQPEDLVHLDTAANAPLWPAEQLRLFRREYKSLLVTMGSWEQYLPLQSLFEDVPKLMTSHPGHAGLGEDETTWLRRSEPDSIPILAHVPAAWKMAGAPATSFWIRQQIAERITK